MEEIDTIETAAVVPFSCEDAGQKICAFVTGENTNTKQLREEFMKLGVAEIKFPDKFLFLKSLPLNSWLKVDRLQLLQLLEK